MESKTKQRIVGGLVLVAVFAIFLPLLFHRPNPTVNFAQNSEAPSAPNKPQIQFDMPVKESTDDVNANKTNTPAAATTTAESAAPVTQVDANKPADAPVVNNAIASPSSNATEPVHPNVVATTAETTNEPKTVEAPVNPTNTLSAKTPPIDKPTSPTTQSTLPPASAQPAAVMPSSASTQSEDNSNMLAVANAPKPLLKAPASVVAKPVKAKTPTTGQWVLQVGSFSNPSNVATLLKKLKTKQLAVHIKKQTLKGHQMTRVYIGPFSAHDQAVNLQVQLKKELHLNTVIQKT